MLRFLISQFFSKDKAFELLEDHEDKITEFSQKNKHLSSAVKTGFRLWSIWRLFLLLWYGFLFLLIVGGIAVFYIIITNFI